MGSHRTSRNTLKKQKLQLKDRMEDILRRRLQSQSEIDRPSARG
jgi:uncharacterized protein YdcH (DUF465 family)